MRTIAEIKARRAKGLKKWGPDLIQFAKHKIETNLTNQEVLDWLNAPPYEMNFTIHDYNALKRRYFKKQIPVLKPNAIKESTQSNKVKEFQNNNENNNIIAQNEDKPLPFMTEDEARKINNPPKKNEFDLGDF